MMSLSLCLLYTQHDPSSGGRGEESAAHQQQTAQPGHPL